MHQSIPLNHPKGSLSFPLSQRAGDPNEIPGHPGARIVALPHAFDAPPFNYERARQIYLRLRANKLAGGATIRANEAPRRRIHELPVLRPRGELITAAQAVRLIADPTWGLQGKLSDSVLLSKTKKGVEAISRRPGVLARELAATLAQATAHVPWDWVIEGTVDHGFLAVDLLAVAGVDLQPLEYRWRHAALLELLRPARTLIRVIETAWETAAKTELLQRLHDGGGTGIVFRKSRRVAPGSSEVLEYTFATGAALHPLPGTSKPGTRQFGRPSNMKGNN